MTRTYPVLAVLVLGAALAFSAANTSAQSAPSPTTGTKLTSGLLSPKGLKIGPDGMIYIAEAGTGGDIIPPGPGAGRSGFTGRISRIDPATGARATVADKLPSNNAGGVEGPADVAFIGGHLYYLQAHGGAFYGFPSNPTGLYRVNKDGTVALVADIGRFGVDNPLDGLTGARPQDISAGGIPAGMAVRDGAFLVAEGSEVAVDSPNEDQVLKITTTGAISRFVAFHGDAVLSGTTTSDTGPLYVSALGRIPFLAAESAVYQIGYPTGNITSVAGGFSALSDVKVGPRGQLYALSYGDFSPDGPGLLGSGKVVKLNATAGTLTPIVTGFTSMTKFVFAGDTAYVVNFGQSAQAGVGEIWKIDNVSSLAALPAPASPHDAASSGPLASIDGLFAALNIGDAAAAAAFYADNAVAGDAVGKAAIRARLEAGIAAGIKHARISGQVFDDGHVEVVDEVRGPFHALVTRRYEFDNVGNVKLSKELRSQLLDGDSAAPISAPNTGTGPGHVHRGRWLATWLVIGAAGIAFVAAGGSAVRRRRECVPVDDLAVWRRPGV